MKIAARLIITLVLCLLATPSFAQCTPGTIACNSTVTATLSSSDCVAADGSFYEIWTFTGTAGQVVTINMRSTTFDTYLYLFDPNNVKVAEDDDSGGGVLGTDSALDFTLNASGTWTILTNSYSPEEEGAYKLSLTCSTSCIMPMITTQPKSLSANSGDSPIFFAETVGTGLTYQWYRGTPPTGTPVTNETAPTLSFEASDTTAGSYYLVVTGCGTSVTSNVVSLTLGGCDVNVNSVTSSAPSVIAGEPLTLTATASATSGDVVLWAWYRADTPTHAGAFVGEGQTVTTTISEPTTFFALAGSTCGAIDFGSVDVGLNTGPCGTNENQLCLNNLRYRVTLVAKTPSGTVAQGVALYQTNVFGYFSLPALTSNPGNPEVFVKVVGPVNGVPWIFYSGLTNLDYTITVFDTQTGQTFNTYHKAAPPAGSFQSFGDFDVAGAVSQQCSNVSIASAQVTTDPDECFDTRDQLCLLDRFLVTLSAKDNPTRTNNTGDGVTLPINTNFGFFTVPELSHDTSNIEAFVKMVDATALNAGYWVFLGGLTDFELKIMVTDTQTGKQKIYTKPAGSTCGWNDTTAFPQ